MYFHKFFGANENLKRTFKINRPLNVKFQLLIHISSQYLISRDFTFSTTKISHFIFSVLLLHVGQFYDIAIFFSLLKISHFFSICDVDYLFKSKKRLVHSQRLLHMALKTKSLLSLVCFKSPSVVIWVVEFS